MQALKMRELVLACAAALGMASAWGQSSVNLYVVVDANVTNVRVGKAAGGGNIWRVEDGTALGLAGSRVGFRGVEDLGGGLRAGFVLENGFTLDTGTLAQGGRMFGRQGFITVSHASYGEIRAGRQYMVGDTVSAIGLPFGGAMVTKTSTSISGAGFTSLPVWLDAARADNVLHYESPTFGGFNGTVQIAPGEGTNDRFQGGMLRYKGGALTAGLSYEWNTSRTTGSRTNKSVTGAFAYTLPVARIGVSVQHATNVAANSGNGEAANLNFLLPATSSGPQFTADRMNGGLISCEVPIGALTLGAEYLAVKFENAVGRSAKLERVGFGSTYALSKKATFYAGLSQVVGDLRELTSQSRVLNAGVRLSF
jgi:GBP family porin